MVNTQNNYIIFIKRPEDYAVAGEHFISQHPELAPNLEDGVILTRRLYLSLDSYKSFLCFPCFPCLTTILLS